MSFGQFGMTDSTDGRNLTHEEESVQKSISILSRGLRLLSIAQLRSLVRDYSLPTSGNKEALTSRLIMYVETFCPTQKNLLVELSIKLKAILSNGSATEYSDRQTPYLENIPTDIENILTKESPSLLLESTDLPPAFGPVQVEVGFDNMKPFVLANHSSDCVPIMQIVPASPGNQLHQVMVSVSGCPETLGNGVFWIQIPDLHNKPILVTVTSVVPPMPVILIIRWMRRVKIDKLTEVIIGGGQEQLTDYNTDSKMSGICPLSRKIITTPARSIKCEHNECFDLTAFLSFAYRNNAWNCPICSCKMLPEDLRVDPTYLLRI